MEQAIRNKLRNTVTQCRKRLEDAVARELEGRFRIYAGADKDRVIIADEVGLSHLTEEDRVYRKDLLDHFEHIKALGYQEREALAQLIREIAFTHLNRLCAYKMMEARRVYVGGQRFREAVSRGINSKGVLFYLADHPEDERLFNTGQQDLVYRHFLDWLGGLLSDEIGVLFSPADPANRLYPPQRVLDEVLNLLNDADLADSWAQDETIGWVYQYFTPKELRDQARKASAAPRNSYELAFRNQFFTPRYVVEFLTDNTLGRLWYEMRQGDTQLRDRCRYLVRRPLEIFLAEGEEPPRETALNQDDLSQEELLKQPVYIAHRPKKDPRELKILDPACGSGHFLLYCFDLLQLIYEEAYTNAELGSALQRDYPDLTALRQAMPGLILKHNLHGIDIDLRATQIAALALWLRCQRAYQEMGLEKSRPKITRSNIVCAEPMPGEKEMLREFVSSLQPKVLGQLVEVVFDKMKLAGEAGSLLKIEEEIRDAVDQARRQWSVEPPVEQLMLFAMDIPKQEQLRFDLSGLTDDQFFEQAETKVVEALRTYAEKAKAHTSQQLQKQLFAEDTVQGFAFVELCHKRFDVVIMNPPFGEASTLGKGYIDNIYPESKVEIHTAFLQRSIEITLSNGFVGVLCSRTFLTISSAQALRQNILLLRGSILFLADLGNGVLDTAVVETCALVFSRIRTDRGVYFRLLDKETTDEKNKALITCISIVSDSTSFKVKDIYCRYHSSFRSIPGSPFAYWIASWALNLFGNKPSFREIGYKVAIGCQTGDNNRFLRLRWEVNPNQIGRSKTWVQYSKGGDYSPYYYNFHLLLNWCDDGEAIKNTELAKGRSVGRSITGVEFHFQHGLTYPLVTNKGLSVRPMPSGGICDNGGPGIFSNYDEDLWYALAVLNSSIYEYLVRCLTSSRHWQAGYLSSTPFPDISDLRKKEQKSMSQRAFKLRQVIDLRNEENNLFNGLTIDDLDEGFRLLKEMASEFVSLYNQLDLQVAKDYGISEEERNFSILSQPERGPGIEIDYITGLSYKQFADQETRARISYMVGLAFGRWDIRYTTAAKPKPDLPDPFAPLPVCPPGMLQGSDGLPATETPDNYPISIDWDGILVDDVGHPDDIVCRVRDVFEVIWKDRAEAIEKEACKILGVKDLRDYFRRPGKGGFWDDHIARYSK